MAHAEKDWTNRAPQEDLFKFQDLAELAARLYSADTFNREGNVYWIDEFEHGFAPYKLEYIGGTGSAYITNTYVNTGGRAAHLHTPLDQGNIASISKLLAKPPGQKLGFEIAFSTPDTLLCIDLYIEIWDGSNYHEAYLRYDVNLKEFLVKGGSGGASVVLENYEINSDPNCFYPMKLVVNTGTDKYMRLVLSDREVDLSAHSMYSEPATGAAYMKIWVGVVNETTPAQNAYFDHFIVTYNEP